jgi:hypothetical protein
VARREETDVDEQARLEARGPRHELEAGQTTDDEFEAELGDASKDEGEGFIDLNSDL